MPVSSINKKVNIVSCSFGENRTLLDTPIQNGNYDIITSFYNDDNYPSRKNSMSSRLKGKIPKILQYKNVDADFYIWMDSKFKVVSSNFVNWMVSVINDNDIALFSHYGRSSIESELIFMEKEMTNTNQYLLSRYDGEYMRTQVEKYLNDSKFKDDKLFACGMFIYSKNLINNHPTFLTDWMIENVIYSVQDQLSLPYLLTKHDINYTTFEEHILHNNYIQYQ